MTHHPTCIMPCPPAGLALAKRGHGQRYGSKPGCYGGAYAGADGAVAGGDVNCNPRWGDKLAG